MKISGVIFFGDSVLAGTGASARELGCAKLVKDYVSIPVSLKARNWNTSKDALARLEQDVLKQTSFSHVVILFGNNDCWLEGPDKPKIPLVDFIENMQIIIEKILSNGQTPILSTLQLIDIERFVLQFPELLGYEKKSRLDIAQFQEIYNQEILKISEAKRILLVDIRTPLKIASQNKDLIALDGIHPNDYGHQIIAEEITAFLKRLDPATQNLNQPR
jgi:acyl-CoA thioesterase I